MDAKRKFRPPVWLCLQAYCCFINAVVNGLASVILMAVFWDSENVPLCICLYVYSILSAIGVLSLIGWLELWERWGRRFPKVPDPRGPRHHN
jgi:hypothetical protein